MKQQNRWEWMKHISLERCFEWWSDYEEVDQLRYCGYNGIENRKHENNIRFYWTQPMTSFKVGILFKVTIKHVISYWIAYLSVNPIDLYIGYLLHLSITNHKTETTTAQLSVLLKFSPFPRSIGEVRSNRRDPLDYRLFLWDISSLFLIHSMEEEMCPIESSAALSRNVIKRSPFHSAQCFIQRVD